MFVLPILHNVLSQVLSPPDIHTAVLLTPAGQLISYASDAETPKDEIRIVVGVSGEVWQETKEQGEGMVDSEVGRIVVVPVERTPSNPPSKQPNGKDTHIGDKTPPPDPLMLIALNADEAVDWDELLFKARDLANHLADPINKYRDRLAIPASATVSPAGRLTR